MLKNSKVESHWATEVIELSGEAESTWLLQRKAQTLLHTELRGFAKPMPTHSDFISTGYGLEASRAASTLMKGFLRHRKVKKPLCLG